MSVPGQEVPVGWYPEKTHSRFHFKKNFAEFCFVFGQVKLAGWKGEKPGTWFSDFRKGKQVGVMSDRFYTAKNVKANTSCVWPFLYWVRCMRSMSAHRFCPILVQFSYSGSEGVPVHVVQLTFLQLLSATARQTFTYNCLNSVAWLHGAAQTYEPALRFRGANGEELTHENTQYISALYDGCQVRGAPL